MNRFEPYLDILKTALRRLDHWREGYGSESSVQPENINSIDYIVDKLRIRLEGNYPFHHPRYAGQMLKPPHPVSWLAYSLAMTINPNNHALDGGPPTSEMEKEVMNKMAAMVGFHDTYLGHLTSNGTIANLEALFVAREIHPGKTIAASANAHYTHRRMCRVLNADFLEIPVDANGMPDLAFVKTHGDEIGTLVVTMGTTGLGYTEPLADLLELASEHNFRIHADAAYGGFFKLIENHLPKQHHWQLLSECDSIVIDPHKHGLQPYGCGSVLYKDPATGKYFKHDSPYTYFTSDDLHLGEISLECSRAGASAAAFWATLELFPLDESGLGSVLIKTRNAAERFADLIRSENGWELYNEPDLDITGYFKMPDEPSLSAISTLNKTIFDTGMNKNQSGFFLSLFQLPASQFIQKFPDIRVDRDHVTLLRSVFMKEEHLDFVDELTKQLFSIKPESSC